MRIKINTILWGGLAIFVLASRYAFAQVPDTAEPTATPQNPTKEWQETVGNLKKSAQTLLGESRKLSDENKALFDEVLDLEKSIEAMRNENTKLATEPSRLNQLIEEKDAEKKSLEAKIKELEEQVSKLKSEGSSLEEKLSQLEESEEQKETQINDFNAKKADLTADLKARQSLLEKEMQQAEVDRLTGLLSESESKEQELKKAIADATEQYISQADYLAKLEKENQGLQGQLSKAKN